MVPTKTQLLIKIIKKMVLSVAILFGAMACGSPVGVVLLFLYAWLIFFRFEDVKRFYDKVANTPLGIMKLWDWFKGKAQ